MTETLTDRFIDTSYLTAPEPEAKPQPSPGRYFLQFGAVEAKFIEEKSGENERGVWSIPAHVEVLPKLTIVGAEDGDPTFAGTELSRFYRLDTRPVRVFGRQHNWSTLSEALKLCGLSMPTSGNVEETFGAAAALTGMTTPVPIFITLTGKMGYKSFFQNAEGTRTYFKESLFRTGDDLYRALAGESGVPEERLAEDVERFRALKLEDYKADGGRWGRLGYVTEGRWTLKFPGENVLHDKVWANLEPTELSWRVKRG